MAPATDPPAARPACREGPLSEIATELTGNDIIDQNEIHSPSVHCAHRRGFHRRAALIVAHGQPSAPEGPETAIAALARAVARRLPGWRVRGATLAAPGALEAALAALPGPVPVYPHFMTDGWFVGARIPQRLAAVGRADCPVLAPFGRDPASAALCLRAALDGARAHGLDPAATTLLIAAHGSPSDPRPAAATRAVAGAVAAALRFRAVAVGFVDEPPSIAEAARESRASLCLPFFAARNNHVTADLPAALARAGFAGALLDPVGEHPAVPRLIAAALRRAAEVPRPDVR
jgi:sirohydrochlorin ferrochelatase